MESAELGPNGGMVRCLEMMVDESLPHLSSLISTINPTTENTTNLYPHANKKREVEDWLVGEEEWGEIEGSDQDHVFIMDFPGFLFLRTIDHLI